MDTRERRWEGEERPATGAGGDGAPLDEMRQAGQRFLARADEAIARALSGDSETFLKASRQLGGQ